MKNVLSGFLIAVAVFIFSSSLVSAATLTVAKIGSLDLEGKTYNQWWYSSTNPTLYGTATPNSQVTIKIDDIEGSATADGSGNWQFYSTNLTNGNHQVMITSGGETVTFALNIGESMPEGTSSATTGKGGVPVPMTGGSDLTIYVALSAILILGGAALLLRNKKEQD